MYDSCQYLKRVNKLSERLFDKVILAHDCLINFVQDKQCKVQAKYIQYVMSLMNEH